MTSDNQRRVVPTGDIGSVSRRTIWLVIFDECKHAAWLLDEEYGDGSAWCQTCGEFRCYVYKDHRVPS